MERMTDRKEKNFSMVDFADVAIDRLRAIEDILGEDYDLDRLRELVEADRERRISIWTPDEQRDIRKAVKVAVGDLIQIGESLVDVPIERIKKLVEADREGRCAVLPISTPSIAYTVDRKGGYISSGFYRTPGSVLHDIERGYIIVKDRESAEAVLKGGQDGN